MKMKKRMNLAARRRLSLKMRGTKNPFYGRRHSRVTKLKLSAGARGKRNPMYGRKHSKATIAKIRQARLTRSSHR